MNRYYFPEKNKWIEVNGPNNIDLPVGTAVFVKYIDSLFGKSMCLGIVSKSEDNNWGNYLSDEKGNPIQSVISYAIAIESKDGTEYEKPNNLW